MNLKERVRKHPIVAFVVLAYAGCWVIWIPVLLSLEVLRILSFHIPFRAPLFLMVSTITAPTLAGFVMQGGRQGLLVAAVIAAVVIVAAVVAVPTDRPVATGGGDPTEGQG